MPLKKTLLRMLCLIGLALLILSLIGGEAINEHMFPQPFSGWNMF
jgi:hypothetical protein